MSHQVEIRFTNGGRLMFSGFCPVPDEVSEHDLSNLRMDLRRMESYATTGGRHLSLNVGVIVPPPPPAPEPIVQQKPAKKTAKKKPAAPAKKKVTKKTAAKKQGELDL